MAGEPVGTITTRGNGEAWKKTEHGKDWKSLGFGGVGKSINGPADETSGETSGWKELQRSFGLDGHLPHETTHSSHVQMDTEGNIDAKPVLSWTDLYGNKRHSYTMDFHRDRAAALCKKVGEHYHRIEAAHDILQGELEKRAGTPEGDIAAVAMIHLRTGHKVDHLMLLRQAHAAVPAKRDEYEQDEVEVEKGMGSEVPHPDRTHFLMPHVHGHAYPTSVVDKGLATHVASKLKGRLPISTKTTGALEEGESAKDVAGGRLFAGASAAKVKKVLEDVGVGDIEGSVIRHHALMKLAADLLSKCAPVDLADPEGLGQLQANIQQVSTEIGQRYGHHPAPEDMAYIPPTVFTAYVEDSNGAALWPNIFPLEAKCTSAKPAADSSIEVSKSQTKTAATPSPSTPATRAPQPRTPTPSLAHSTPLLHGRPWYEVADLVELELEKSGDGIDYDVRLPPTSESGAPIYLKSIAGQKVEVTNGVRLKAEVAGKAIYLTFIGKTEDAMEVIAHGDEVEKFTISNRDWQSLSDAEWSERYRIVNELNRKYDQSLYGSAETNEKSYRNHPGPEFGSQIGVIIGPPPSPNRAEYPFVGTINFRGLPIDVENLQGSFREGTDRHGTKWRIEMQAHYGEIRAKSKGLRGAKGMDGDRLDVYVGNDPASDVVIVVDQMVPATGEIDEQKVMLGFSSVEEALATYRRQYNDPRFYGGYVAMNFDRFMGQISDPKQAGLPLEKSLTNIGTLFNSSIGLEANYPPPASLVNFQKAVSKVVRLLKLSRKGKASLEELAAAHAECESAEKLMKISMSKAEPGPEGAPDGTKSVHADGETWEKQADGWHDLGVLSDDESAGQDEDHTQSSAYVQAAAVVQKLQEKLKQATDTESKSILLKQIDLLKKRMAALSAKHVIGGQVDMAKSMTEAIAVDLKNHASRAGASSPLHLLMELADTGNPVLVAQAAHLRRLHPDDFLWILGSWMVNG